MVPRLEISEKVLRGNIKVFRRLMRSSGASESGKQEMLRLIKRWQEELANRGLPVESVADEI